MTAPPIWGVAETVLYADDLAASRAFFAEFLGLPIVLDAEGLVAFAAGTSQVLLVFDRALSGSDKVYPGGVIPGHRGEGPAHMAFHVSLADYDAWKAHFEARGRPILSEVTFDGGGRSLYFEDPAGNVLELATPGHWRNF